MRWPDIPIIPSPGKALLCRVYDRYICKADKTLQNGLEKSLWLFNTPWAVLDKVINYHSTILIMLRSVCCRKQDFNTMGLCSTNLFSYIHMQMTYRHRGYCSLKCYPAWVCHDRSDNKRGQYLVFLVDK